MGFARMKSFKCGHPKRANTYVRPYNGQRICLLCQRSKNSRWAKENRARIYARQRRWRQANRGRWYAQAQKWKKANPGKVRAADLRLKRERRERIYRLLGRVECVRCGARERLEFHHRDRKAKKFTIGDYTNLLRPLAELKREARKCVVLCRSCHMKQHRTAA
jgi:hypothetical protein